MNFRGLCRHREWETKGARFAGLRQKLDDLDDAFLFRHVNDQETYEHQRDRLREQVALAEVELDESPTAQAVIPTSQDLSATATPLFGELVMLAGPKNEHPQG